MNRSEARRLTQPRPALLRSGAGRRTSPPPRAALLRAAGPSANDRFKHAFNTVLCGSLATAALLHFLVLALWPHFTVQDWRLRSQELAAVEIPPELEIPPPPDEIFSPQVPVLNFLLELSEEITIPEMVFTRPMFERLPAPPVPPSVDLSEQPVFTPRTVEPRLERRERGALQRYLERNYPSNLLNRGIGAQAILWIFISDDGEVRETQVVQSSGYAAFDKVAEAAVRTVRFTPAMNRDTRVPVWVQLPIIWQVRR